MIVLTMVYPLLETLGLLTQWGRYNHLLRGIDNLTSSMGREPISDMYHLVVRSSIALPLGVSVTRAGGRRIWGSTLVSLFVYSIDMDILPYGERMCV